jgi:two-component system OmpR family sensor kinase
VKLTTNARLRIATISITTILTATLGGFITQQSYQSAIATLDRSIETTVADAAQSPHQELSAALFHIEEFSLDVSLLLVARDGSITTVNESTIDLLSTISLKQASEATKRTISGASQGEYRFRSLLISGGDYLVVAGSTHEALKNFHSNLISVALSTSLMSALAFLILTFYTRRLKNRDDEDALERMQVFLGDASHELRTPLTVIKGYVEMLSKGQMTEEADRSRAFSRVTSEIGRMETLIHDLLLLAELGESGQRDQEIIDISEILKSYAEDFRLLHPERQISLDIESNLRVEMAPDHLARFIQNALNNISRHTASTAAVKISLRSLAKKIELVIEDGGPGLPEAAYNENIQSLKRFDQSRSRENGGSGLGMSIMAGVIAKAGGEFALRKSSLGGLAIVVTLPAYR